MEAEAYSAVEGEKEYRRQRLPGPRGAPFVWAESRQELCETLPYYRSFHSGCYASSAKLTSSASNRKDLSVIRDCIPYGYLLAGFGASRDAWEDGGRVVISHGGGKSGTEDSTKRETFKDAADVRIDEERDRQPNGDQTLDDWQIACLVHSYRCQTPIVLLMARDYKLSHFILPCAFAVLGWYWITDVWCEREPSTDGTMGWVRWKFRFQYVQSQGHPWWLGDEHVPFWNPKVQREHHWAEPSKADIKVMKQSADQQWSSGKRMLRPSHLTSSPIAVHHPSTDTFCGKCQQASPSVFAKGWICLSQECEAFWKLPDGSTIEGKLDLDPVFLSLRAEPPHFAHGGLPFSLHPLLASHSLADQGDALRGLHCICGRLTCRRYDHYWHCAHCGFIRPCQAASIVHLSPLVDLYTGLELCKVHPASSIRALSIKIPSDKLAVTSFYFPESLGGGEVHLIESIDGRQDEADEIFDAMQQGPCWSRNANHFQLPVYPRERITFHRHPLSCNTVKGVLLSQQFTCNYGAEYKHSVKMGTVHLDQAPRSVTRALKLISERTKKVIASTGNDDDFNEVYPVKYRETQKMNFHDDGEPGLGPTVSSLSLGVEAKMQFRLKEKYVKQQVEGGEIDAKGSITMANRILLTLTLRHGCIVIQHGRRLQEMIEHAVQPQMGGKQRGDNGVRIAVTARRIDKVSAEMQVQSKRRKTMIAQSVKKLPGGAGWASN